MFSAVASGNSLSLSSLFLPRSRDERRRRESRVMTFRCVYSNECVLCRLDDTVLFIFFYSGLNGIALTRRYYGVVRKG